MQLVLHLQIGINLRVNPKSPKIDNMYAQMQKLHKRKRGKGVVFVVCIHRSKCK